jgi:hypothetical protein
VEGVPSDLGAPFVHLRSATILETMRRRTVLAMVLAIGCGPSVGTGTASAEGSQDEGSAAVLESFATASPASTS